MTPSTLGSVGTGVSGIADDVSRWFGRAWANLSGGIRPVEVAALVVAAVALVAYAVVQVAIRPNRRLPEALESYRIGQEETPVESPPAGAVTLPSLQRMAERLSRLAERRGFRSGLQARIQRAGLSVTAGELLLTVTIGGLLVVALGAVAGGPLGALLALAVVALAPPATLQLLADRRRRRIESQLVDLLKLLAASLRSGFSLLQGLGAMLGRLPEPMAGEIRQAFAATRVGVPVDDALAAAAERSGSRDFTWAVTAISIQREVGGNLAEILDTVADTMKERGKLHREVRTLTAEGRLSAVILGALPFFVGIFLHLADPSYLALLFHTFFGVIALVGGVVLEIVGCLWLYRTVQIEI